MRHPRLAAGSLAAVALIAAACGGCSSGRKSSSAGPPSAAVANVPVSAAASATPAASSATASAGVSLGASASSSASASAWASASASASPSTGTNTSASASAGTGTGASTGTVIKLAQTDNLGNILVDSQGRTIYLFDKDTSTASTCYNACALAWPPVTTAGAPVAAHGTDDGLLGTATRSDGRTQVLYNGHPLYYFSGDTSQGDTNGEGSTAFGATWYVANGNGHKIVD